jgi:hypothetical protein
MRAIGAVGVLALVVGLAGDALGLTALWPSAPVVRSTAGLLENPFAASFSVFNPSAGFSMENVRMACRVIRARVGSMDIQNNVFLETRRELLDLPAGGVGHYVCDVPQHISGGDVRGAVTIELIVEWSTLGVQRSPTVARFVWEPERKTWAEGPRLN